MNSNMLLRTDLYKVGHCLGYKPGTDFVYSYLTARSSKNFDEVMFFGLQYYLKEYLTRPVTRESAEEFFHVVESVVGECPQELRTKINDLVELGYWPIRIKAVREGTILPVRNVLMTIQSTNPKFYWCVGFLESLLLKVWYTCTVATQCLQYRRTVNEGFKKTSDLPLSVADYYVHDFGYRGDTSEEGAAISGVAHLLSFLGSDTIPAFMAAKQYYGAESVGLMASVPASEHSVMCSYGRDGEIEAFERMLELYPTGIVSIVSDTYSIWNVIEVFCRKLKQRIELRQGKVTFRPDSGVPEYIICGNPNIREECAEQKGCVRLLDEVFGHTVNSKGYKVLNQKVGLIYGDGMYLERYKRTLARLEEMGWSAENLVIGVGGILRNHSRDTLGFAIKATAIEVNGVPQEIEKDPVTDRSKKSLKGLMYLERDEITFRTVDQCSKLEEKSGLLETVFEDGKLYNNQTLSQIRKLVKDQIGC